MYRVSHVNYQMSHITYHKYINTYGQESPYLKLSLFFFENIQTHQFFLVKLIGQCIPDGNGRGIARDINKKIHFQNSTKNVNKVESLLYISAF